MAGKIKRRYEIKGGKKVEKEEGNGKRERKKIEMMGDGIFITFKQAARILPRLQRERTKSER